MLIKLKIYNYALIDSLEISFKKGMTSITGETGAGKSIILGGLSMVLGSRVDNSKIINKEEKCFVEASFDLTDLDIKDYFTKNDLDYDQITIIRREVNQSGKSRAFINDTPVKLDQLSELTNNLIDVHSQIPMIGASGAIGGVLGAYLINYPNARVLVLIPLGFFSQLIKIRSLYVLGFWFILQFISSGGGVAYAAHIGGFVSGMILILFFNKKSRKKNKVVKGPWG